MSFQQHYNTCCQNMNRPVRIRTGDGKVHTGVVSKVDRSRVYLRPIGNRPQGGLGYGFRGYPGYGYGWGWGWGIALASIAAIALLPLFFW